MFATDVPGWLDAYGKAGLFLVGPAGVGKTGLCIALAGQLPDHYSQAMVYTTWRRMLAEVRETYSRDSVVSELDVLQRYQSAPLLVLDEFGSTGTYHSDWAPKVAWDLWESRYQGAREDPPKLTLGTANLGLSEAEEEFGPVMGGPIVSRVRGVCRVLKVQGSDLRQPEEDA